MERSLIKSDVSADKNCSLMNHLDEQVQHTRRKHEELSAICTDANWLIGNLRYQ